MSLKSRRESWPVHVLVWGFLVSAAAAQTANVLRGDTSFESGSTGGHFVIGTLDADGRFVAPDPASPAAASFDRSTGVHGASSMRLDVGPGRPAAIRFLAPKAVALPCTASLYIRGGKGAATVRLAVADDAAGVAATAEIQPPNYWRRLVATVAAPDAPDGEDSKDPTAQPIVTVIAEAGQEAAVWIDAVQLEEGGEATSFAMAFPLTYGIRLSDDDPPVATAPLRLTGHVVNDTEYIAVCRVVARLYPLTAGRPAAQAVAEAEARVGMAPRQGKDALLEFGPIAAGTYVAAINRADGPLEEEARLPLTVGDGPPLRLEGGVMEDDPARVSVTVFNQGGDPVHGKLNVWLGPRPVRLDPVPIRLDAGESAVREFELPGSYDEQEARLRVETGQGAVEIAVPVPAADAAADPAPSP